MLSSFPLLLVFTVVFALTGAYALARMTVPGPVGPAVSDRVAELSHVLMSVAMIAMAWGWTGGRDRPSGIVQVVVFASYAVWFLARLITSTSWYAGVSNIYHAVAAAVMVWMVLLVPPLSAAGAMPGMAAMAGDGPGSGASTSASVVTSVFVVLLLAAAALWAVRAFRADSCADTGAAPSGVARLPEPRLDGSCHLVMSLGAGGLLLAMS